MYGMGAGPTRGRVVYLDDSYDVNGRAVVNGLERSGGVNPFFGGADDPVVTVSSGAVRGRAVANPVVRSGGVNPFFGGADDPVVVKVETPAPLKTPVVEVINSGGTQNVAPAVVNPCWSIYPASDMDTCLSESIRIETLTAYTLGAAAIAAWWFFGKRGRR